MMLPRHYCMCQSEMIKTETSDGFRLDCPSCGASVHYYDGERLQEDAEGGLKYDKAKTRWDLFAWEFLEEVAQVLTKGAVKYEVNNWMKVEDARLISAAMRHFYKGTIGEKKDPDTGLSHFAHCAANIMFLWYKEKVTCLTPTVKSTTQK